MISEDSPLIRLPKGIGAKQKIFLDGIRHAAEIADRAYLRLCENLCALAKEKNKDDVAGLGTYTDAFLDAWAFIDSVDRFRSLLRLMPGVELNDASPEQTFFGATQDVRNLRNAADHIAQKADYYVAHDTAALGSLSWMTLLEPSTGRFALCAIVPGTILPTTRVKMVNPNGLVLSGGAELVYLHVGEHHVSLSDAHHLLQSQVRTLEELIRKSAIEQGLSGELHGRDLMVVALMVQQDSET